MGKVFIVLYQENIFLTFPNQNLYILKIMFTFVKL